SNEIPHQSKQQAQLPASSLFVNLQNHRMRSGFSYTSFFPSGAWSSVHLRKAPSASFSSGWKNHCAIKVGTTALPITTVTRIVYCSWVMMPRVYPKSAEMLPKVKPVLMSNVVYIPTLLEKRNAVVSG